MPGTAQALRAGPAECRARQAELQAESKRKRDLCLQLEIATGVDTPPAYTQERMEYQVARLSDSLSGRRSHDAGLNDPLQETLVLAREWLLSPLPPDANKAELETRFRRVYAELQSQLA